MGQRIAAPSPLDDNPLQCYPQYQEPMGMTSAVTYLVGDVVASWYVRPTSDRAVRVRTLAADLRCVFGQDTKLSLYLSPARCTNGYR